MAQQVEAVTRVLLLLLLFAQSLNTANAADLRAENSSKESQFAGSKLRSGKRSGKLRSGKLRPGKLRRPDGSFLDEASLNTTSFIVTFKPDQREHTVFRQRLAKLDSDQALESYRARIKGTWNKATVGGGFAAVLSPQALADVLADESVEMVVEDTRYYAMAVGKARVHTVAASPVEQAAALTKFMTATASNANTTPLWNLDRIDQTRGGDALDGQYINHNFTGAGTDIYIVDTGIDKTHADYAGRLGAGADFTTKKDSYGWGDCTGHGTHCAGIAAGTTFGVAKEATLHSVRVLDCNGEGSLSGVLEGIDWIITQAASNAKLGRPSIASLSLGGPKSFMLNTAVRNAVDAGMHTYFKVAQTKMNRVREIFYSVLPYTV